MNYESQPQDDAGDRFEAERPRSVQEGAARYIDHLIAGSTDPVLTAQIRSGYELFGLPFAVYLKTTNAGPDPAAMAGQPQREQVISAAGRRDLEADFLDAYLGTYPDRRCLIIATIDALGWREDLDRLLAGNQLLQAMLAFDQGTIWAFIDAQYQLVELDGSVFVFEPEP